MLSEQEVLEELTSRTLNPKTNNYIFHVDSLQIIKKIPKTTTVYSSRLTYGDLYDDIYMKKEMSKNVFIDFDKVSVFEMLSYILKEHGVEESLPFRDRLDVFKFNSRLKKVEDYTQIICYNLESLSEVEAQLLNELYYFNSDAYSVITFALDAYPTYFLTGNRILDGRENFMLFKVRKDYVKEKEK